MKHKSLIQLIIFILIIFLLIIFFKIFFNKDLNLSTKKKFENSEIIDKEVDKNISMGAENIILNLEYKSSDALGNEYVIKSKSAESDLKNLNLLKLIDVSAIVYLQDKEPIYIYSDFAKHDKISFDTKFYENVVIKHSDLNISSENLDLMYEKNLVNLYNIKKAFYQKSQLIADKITLNILTRDLSINMYKNDTKIKILYK